MSAVTRGAGWWLGDEVRQSSDPARHASELARKAQVEGMRYVLLQVDGANHAVAPLIRAALEPRGIVFGTWAQHYPGGPGPELDEAEAYGTQLHAVNVESRPEEQLWTNDHFRRLFRLPQGYAVCFTQAAFDGLPGVPSPVLAARWVAAGFDAMPEANAAENPGLVVAPIAKMIDLAAKLGWSLQRVAPVAYLIDKSDGSQTPPAAYPDIGLTAGRWSAFRYGNLSDGDLAVMRAWPRVDTEEPTMTSGQARLAIEGILAALGEEGLATEDALALVRAMSTSWKARQARLGQPTNRKQRLMVTPRIAGTTGPQWLAVDDTIADALDKAGVPA